MAAAENPADKQIKGEAFISLFMRLRAKGVEDSRLFSALEKTPRYYFVEAKYKNLTLANCVLPIECGEYIERLDEQLRIIQALRLEPKHRVLEVGTGSGFSAALMALLALRVTSLERYKTLCERARQNFLALGRGNIILRHADALQERQDSGPFDRIILWPAIEQKPRRFIDLLAGNGLLIAPIGAAEGEQMLICYHKTGSRFETSELFPVRYLPIVPGIAAML
ncbi:MAG: protein-L-isoaspartate(D-aspartate) O-methyltransferase [Candidatus Tokpelaia sp.]|nr:MAG: protein-L-isoaspartate(D-aspartate) O-methyltransferase [Candidatus Tokpelaia sp.]KAA6207690.1 MAG: protein-L-isoaspartate(D-aspartate) O-methyltransferase [Candidatus Tokpelaia sp.]